MKSIYFLIVLLLFFSGCSQPQPLAHKFTCKNEIYALKSSECLSMENFHKKIEAYQIIFIGDYHDETAVQEFVARFITNNSKKIHVANEWFTPKHNELLDDYCRGDVNASVLRDDINWTKKVGYDFKNYASIYKSVKDAKGKLYGINMSRAFRKKISDQNISSMSSKEKLFFDSLDLNVTAHQQLVSPYLDHCKHSKNISICKDRMYRVQVAWDSYMGHESALLAQNILADNNSVLIVFVGAMHLSQSLGVNMRFARESNMPFVTLLPHSDKELSVRHGDAEYIFFYDDNETK